MQSSKLPSLEQLDNEQLLGLAALSAGEYCRRISEEWYQRLELAGDTIEYIEECLSKLRDNGKVDDFLKAVEEINL